MVRAALQSAADFRWQIKRQRRRSLSLSEVMTILVLFHGSGYRNLKQFYLEFVCVYLRAEFPGLVSYNRFVEFQSDALML